MNKSIKQNNIPDGWKEKRLGELFEFKNGVNADISAYGSGIKFINVMDVFQGNCISVGDIKGMVTLPEKMINENIVLKGDVLFNRTSETLYEIGLTSVYLDLEKVVFGGFVIRGRPIGKEIYDQYKKYCFSSNFIRKEIIRRGQGVVRANIGQRDLNKVLLLLPPLKEQKKIVSILETWDLYLEKLERKIELKKNVKKGLMKKVFLQELKFNDEDGKVYSEWKEQKMMEIGDFQSGVGFSEVEQGGKEGVPFYKVSDMNIEGNELFMRCANNFVNFEQVERLGYKIIHKKSIIFAKVGAAIFLERKRIAEYFLIDNNMMSFTPKINIMFSKYLFDNLRLSKYAQVGALPSYNAKDLKIIKIKVPSKEEQEKISKFLSKIDEEIEVLERKKKIIEDQKKYLLNNLITGKIRTPESMKV